MMFHYLGPVKTRIVLLLVLASTCNSLPLNRSESEDQEILQTFQLPSEVLINDLNDCIENRIEAIEVGRQCSRRCRKDVPCENTRKQCLCDGLCGMSCIKPDLNCAELPKIENGDYFPKSAKFNTKIVYKCNPGYYLFGSRERLCQGDEDWSGLPAECMAEGEFRVEANRCKTLE